MQVNLDANVRTHDGEDAGAVERAIIDPSRNQVAEFVINTGGFIGRSVRVPCAEIEAASREGDALRLRLSKADLEALPQYVPDQYVAPPVGWAPPAGYAFPDGGWLWPAGYGLGIPGRSGSATAAAVAAGPASPSPEGSPPEGSGVDRVGIVKGAIVLAGDGHDVGVVDDIRFDAATGQLTGFVLRIGGTLRTLFGGGESTGISCDLIDHVEEDAVYLRATKAELQQLAQGRATTAPR